VIQILQQYGFKTCCASSGEEAINIVKSNNIDLIFMDTLMPGMDGHETTKVIKNQLKKQDIPIITLSANVFDDDKQKAIKNGADDFLSKPIDEKQLIKILQKYLNVKLKFDEKKDLQKQDEEIFTNLSKEFFISLKNFALQMDNSSIYELLEKSSIDNKSKLHIKNLIEEFDYQALVKVCEQRI
jgi:CheY-like chemotaxis protein